MLNLDFTGHPYFDIGLAAITAYADKDRPTDLTEEDLAKAADFIETYYTQQPLTSFLTVSLMNSDFTQPAFKDKPERRHDYAKRVARSFGSDVPTSDETCVFTGEPALGLSLSLKTDKNGQPELPPGRAYRQHIPLITGEGTINFSPWGDPGLPVSGKALLCLQFFPMGCRKCNGRLLAVHSDNPKILMAAAREALLENIEGISLANASGNTKLRDASPSAQTLVIETLLRMDIFQQDAFEEKEAYSITAYHLTNSGQTSPLDERSPFIRMHQLPMRIIQFLHTRHDPRYQQEWQRLVERGWSLLPPDKNKSEGSEYSREELARRRRNFLYEDIFRLPDDARNFVRTYLLRVPKFHAAKDDPRGKYSLRTDIKLISWKFTALFLEKVMKMDKKRIEAIRALGDTLASYVKEQGDKKFLLNFYRTKSKDAFMSVLMKANKNYAASGHTPLFGLDTFCNVFLEQDGNIDTLKLDWRFARDLVLIRMIEWLHDNNWLGENLDALPEEQETDNEE